MLLAIIVTALIAFTAGVFSHRYVVAKSLSVKAHVTAELADLKKEIKEEIGKLL